MKERFVVLLQYLVDQGRQASTWRGIILVLTAILGLNVPEEKAAAVALVGMTFAGLAGMLLPDRLSEQPKKEETP